MILKKLGFVPQSNLQTGLCSIRSILMLQKSEVFSAKASRVKPYSLYCEPLITQALDASGFCSVRIDPNAA